ncbi:putative hemolysin [Brevundimonas sp. NPDC055814]
MSMRTGLTRLTLAGALLTMAACAPPKETEPSSPQAVGMANPASVHCGQEGGRSEIRRDAQGGEYGVCIFEDGRQCEEWALFRDKRCVAPPAADKTAE